MELCVPHLDREADETSFEDAVRFPDDARPVGDDQRLEVVTAI